jgi:lipopolysaccharide heptosyltransferase II
VPPNILLVRFSAMGDTLLMTPLIRALRARHPEARITVVTKAMYAPLFQHNPRVTEVIGWEPGSPLGPLGQALRAARFTHQLDLHGSLRSRALRLRVGGRWTGYPKHRVARALLIRTKRNIYRDQRPVAERYFDAARGLEVSPDAGSLELFIPRGALDAAERFVAALGLGSRRQLVAIAPGASRVSKRWPTHHWIALVRRLVGNGNEVLVVGGTSETQVAREIVAAAGEGAGEAVGVASAAGEFDLPGTAALLKRARALVSGDSGAMHLAAAVGTPVVALFGPTVEAFGFFPYHAKATVLQRDLPCRPCSAQGGPRCPLKHHRCLQDLQPDEVLETLRKLPR